MQSRMVARINPNECDRSPFCPAGQACPVGAINLEEDVLPWGFKLVVDPEKCTGCGRCARICPHQAIAMVQRETPGESTAPGQAASGL